MGFAAAEVERRREAGEVEPGLAGKIEEIGVAAARRKFSPEFMNRIDKVLVFRPLGEPELRRILELELHTVQQRILEMGADRVFVLSLTEQAKEYLLREGSDMKYGARHLKRAVERSLINPLSRLLTSGQVRPGDLLRVDYDSSQRSFTFARQAEKLASEMLSSSRKSAWYAPPGCAGPGGAGPAGTRSNVLTGRARARADHASMMVV